MNPSTGYNPAQQQSAPPFIPGKTFLVIKPTTADLTHDVDLIRRMDPLLEIEIGGEIYRTGVHEDGGKHPRWQEVISHQVKGTEREMSIKVLSRDKPGKFEIVGDGKLSLSDTISKRTTSEWYQIFYKNKPAGKVLISMEVVTKN